MPGRRVLLLAWFVSACAPQGRPPVDDAGAADAPTIGPVDLPRFAQDAFAVGLSWFDYDSSSHALSPKSEVYVVEDRSVDPPRYGALAIDGYYDPEDAESGRFAIRTARWDGGWAASASRLVAGNIRIEGPQCVDVFADVEVDCAGDAWQVQLRQYKKMSTASFKTTAVPGLFARSFATGHGEARIAVVDGDLAGLPDPASLAYVESLPADALQLGRAYAGSVRFLVGAKFTLARFLLDDALGIQVARAPIDVADGSVAEDPPLEAFALAAPADRDVLFVSFAADDLIADVDGSGWPHLPPPEGDWDLAFEATADGLVAFVSPGAAVFDAETDDVAGARPPLGSP
jgi:hypothetical protein